MKKYFILAVAAIAVMAACAKVEHFDAPAPGDSLISFSVVNHRAQTKSHPLPYTGSAYPTNVPFGTYCWWTEDDWTGAPSDTTFVFMNNEKVSYSGTQWVPSSTYYWTKSGKLTFASYSPFADADSTLITYRTAPDTLGRDSLRRFDFENYGYSEVPKYDFAKGFTYKDYRIVPDADVDLMYADLAANCTQKTNANGDKVQDENGSSYSGVPTIFNHALCRVGFAFRAIGSMNPNVDSIRVVINSVDIKNIETRGDFTQNPTTGSRWETDHDHLLKNYNFPVTIDTLVLIKDTPDSLASKKNYAELDRKVIVLPQAHLNSNDGLAVTTDQLLTISYTVLLHYTSAPDNTDGSLKWATETLTSVLRLKNCGIPTWRDNQNIIYRISINPYSSEPVTFDPAVAGWEDVDSLVTIYANN